MMAPGISVIIPVFNSEQTLRPLIERLGRVLSQTGREFEVILVNDCSVDGSWNTIAQLARSFDWLRGIDLMRNSGQENALLCGIRAASYDVSVVMDDDLQNPPEEIPKLIAALTSESDVVYGITPAKKHGWWRNKASAIVKTMLHLTFGAGAASNSSEFKIFRTRLRDAFAGYQSPYASIDVLLTWGTTRFSSTEVRHEPRRVGQSNYTLSKLIGHMLNLVTGHSTLPLRISSALGGFFLLIGLTAIVWSGIKFFMRGTTPTALALIFYSLCLFSGLQLLAIGIVGEYLARLYRRSIGCPPYTIRRSVNSLDAADELATESVL